MSKRARPATSDGDVLRHPNHKRAKQVDDDDVLRHPSHKRAKQVDHEDNPYAQLTQLNDTKNKPDPSPTGVLHWFRHGDLRAVDNRSLAAASAKARAAGVPLLACYLFSPNDWVWHGVGAARADFLRESLLVLQADLKKGKIPLVPLTAGKRADKGPVLVDFIKKHRVSHVFANYEYEVDELRRDMDLFKRLKDVKDPVAFELHHDQTVIEPATLLTKGGGPHKVFTPYHKLWLAAVSSNPSLIETIDSPAANDKAAADKLKDLFDHDIPGVPEQLQFKSSDERKRIRKLWPAGHQAAADRLQQFLKKKVSQYAATRSNPAKDSSSRLSAYFATGVLSIREACSACRKANNDSAKFDDSGDPGIAAWVRELVFREFYRHTMTIVPHTAMNLPGNLKFDYVQWEDDEEGWSKWCSGETGMPFVDAGMRQLAAEAYMHNRLRMNVASYLRTNLLLDYRRGERFFAENLVDWDLCNNTNGWEPSYTVFNPVSQAERNDPDGDYIRKWVPELKDVHGKAVFDPFHRLSKKDFAKLGYPEPHVDWAESKVRCLQRYKRDMQDTDHED